MLSNITLLKREGEPDYALVRRSYHVLAAIIGGFIFAIVLGIGIFLRVGSIGVLWTDASVFSAFVVSLLLILILAAYLLVWAFLMVLLVNYFYGMAIIVPEHFWYVRHTPLFKEMLNTVDRGFIAVVEPVEVGLASNILRYGDVMVRLMDGNVVEVDKVPGPNRVVTLINNMKDFMVNPPWDKQDDENKNNEKPDNEKEGGNNNASESPGKSGDDQAKPEMEEKSQGEERHEIFPPQVSVHSKRRKNEKGTYSEDVEKKTEAENGNNAGKGEIDSTNESEIANEKNMNTPEHLEGGSDVSKSNNGDSAHVYELSQEEKEQIKGELEQELREELKEEIKEEVKEEVMEKVRQEVLEEVKDGNKEEKQEQSLPAPPDA